MTRIKSLTSVILIGFVGSVFCDTDVSTDSSAAANATSYEYYNTGVVAGIINPRKYPFESFLEDERTVFKDAYVAYSSLNVTDNLNYGEWLLLNNYGILPDTQESIYEKKILPYSASENKQSFVDLVRKGDILISGHGITGLIGHAAIMITDDLVLEMPGGERSWMGIRDNNRQISKDKWFEIHKNGWITVYQLPDRAVAEEAATWAQRNFYNPSGGKEKTIHITYKLTLDPWSKDPSYCSKLVMHAFLYGVGKREVVNKILLEFTRAVSPTILPLYIKPNYRLINKGRY